MMVMIVMQNKIKRRRRQTPISSHSGIRFYYTEVLRPIDAAILELGANVDQFLMVPAGVRCNASTIRAIDSSSLASSFLFFSPIRAKCFFSEATRHGYCVVRANVWV